ncbi:MAG: hypothetical protein QOJ59_593 [Thermomicrobiales bacterium]|jgi:hypothetical protein|nr:hypothetical protein [Thermomicrobiales bacterium]
MVTTPSTSASDAVVLRPGWWRAAIDRRLGKVYRDLRLLKRRPGADCGWMREEDALTWLATDFSHLKHPAKAAGYALTKICASPFARRTVDARTGDVLLWWVTEAAVFAAWGTPSPGPVHAVPVADAIALTPKQLQYALGMAVRNDRTDRPRPASRLSRRLMTGSSPQTQRKAERKAGIAVRANYCLLGPGLAPPAGRRARYLRGLGRWAAQISTSTDSPFVPIPSPSAAATSAVCLGSAAARPGRVYFDADADAEAYARALGHPVPGYVFVGFKTLDGREVGLWRLVR